jgi:hypothetical protein
MPKAKRATTTMSIHHMLTTANLTIYLAFPVQKAAHRVADHTWSDEIALPMGPALRPAPSAVSRSGG